MALAPERPKSKKRRVRRAPSPGTRVRRRLHQGLRAAWAPDPAPPPPLDRRARLRAIGRHHLAPLALYALLTAFMTYPLVTHFTSHVPGDGGDALMNYWGYWWAREALAQGRNPFFTPLLYAPYGAPLYLHTLNLLNGAISIPVQLAFGTTAAYNAVVFLSFILAGYFASLLVAHVSGSRLAGLVGGVIYAFGSYHMTHLLGHTNLLSSGWLPAYALCLLRATETTGRRRTLLAAGAAGALVLLMLVDWQYVVFALFFTAVYVAYTTVARRSLVPALVAGAIGAAWLVLALPLLVPTVAQLRSGVTQLPDLSAARTYSADLLNFVLPSPLHPWWGGWGERMQADFTAPPVEAAIFLGFLPLALAALGFLWDRRHAGLWALAAMVFCLLALGPVLHVNGRWRFGDSGWSIPLPYAALQRLPGLNVARVPLRFSVMLTLCLAVLAGLGLVQLARRFPRLASGRARLALVPVLLAGLLVEHLALPYQMERVQAPAFYRQLAGSPEAGTILEWPFSLRRARSDYYQTVHGRPIVGGYVARRMHYPLRVLPPLGGLPERGSEIVYSEVEPANLGAWALDYSGVRWIVVYPNDPRLDREGLPQFLSRYAESAPVYQDEETVVYRPRPPGAPTSFLALGRGWYDLEGRPAGQPPARWFNAAASLNAWSFAPEARTYALRFDAWAYHQPRRLQILLDGRPVGEWRVEHTQRFDVPLTLTPGEHTIELRALDTPTSPVSVGAGGNDTRPFSFNISNVELQPRP